MDLCKQFTVNIIVIYLMRTSFCQAAFYVSTGATEWSLAGEECIPVTPEVTAASHSPTTYNVENLDIEFPDNEEIWVGYYQVTRVFEYIGCAEQKSLFSIRPNHVEIKGDPGHCFPRCGESTTVAVTNTRCFCLGYDWKPTVDIKQTRCTRLCDHPKVACGFDTNNIYSYVSIYRINQNVDHSTINVMHSLPGETDCLCFDPSVPRTHYWQSCTASLLTMCDPEKTHRDYRTWIDAANACFRQRVLPLGYTSFGPNLRGGSQLWTGCFKTHVTYKHNAEIAAARRHDKKQYGYLYKDSSSQLKINFSIADSTKRVLCGTGNKHDRRQDTSQQTTAPTSPTQSYMNMSTNATRNSSLTVETGRDLYITIGASAAAFVLVIVIVVAVLVVLSKQRRKKTAFKCKQNANSHDGIEDDDNKQGLVEPNTSEGTRNNYFILQSREMGENENPTYDTTDEHVEYDSTEARRGCPLSEKDTVYNRLDIGNQQTYDHMQSSLKTGQSDYTYDCATAINKQMNQSLQSDNIYNKTEDLDNGLYNHLGEKQLPNISDTNNMYGMHE